MYKILLVVGLLASLPAYCEFKNESEAGVVVTTGNSKTQSYNIKQMSQYSVGKNLLRFDGKYLNAKQKGVLSAENWLLGLRFEHEISAMFSGFLAQSLESDKFAGYLQRYNTDLGGKYFLDKKEKEFVWFFEGGYRYTREHGTNDVTKKYQKARLYSEVEKYWVKTSSTKLWIEYIPNFTVNKAWQINGEASVSSALDSVFSVKSAYLVQYSNDPAPGAVKSDSTFTMSLVAKF